MQRIRFARLRALTIVGSVFVALLAALWAPATTSGANLNCLRTGGNGDRAWINMIICNVNIMNREQNAHTVRLAGHDKRLKLIETINTNQAKAINAVKASVGGLGTRTGALEARAAAVETSVGAVSAKLPTSSYASNATAATLGAVPVSVLSLTESGAGGAINPSANSRIFATATVNVSGGSGTVSCSLDIAPGAFPDAALAMSQTSNALLGQGPVTLSLVGHRDRAAGPAIVRARCTHAGGGAPPSYVSGNLAVWSVPL